jgi:putative ABC transport system ATP-binding protein
MSMIRLKNVSKTYYRGPVAVEALRGVHLDIAHGEFVVVTGKSGCGKSTLLHIIGGLEPPSRGQVLVEGQDLATLKDPELTYFRRDRVGVVFQSFNLLPLLTLKENVALPRALQGIPFHQALKEAEHWLEHVGLAERQHHKPHQVSGGEMQRAAIARALINRPAVVLADEPTGNLDSVNSAQILDLFARLHQEGGHTILLVSHAPEAAQYARRVVHLKDGRVQM